MSMEAAADLARIDALIGQGEQAGPGAGPGPEPERPGPTPEQAMGGLLTVAALVLGQFGFARAAAVWSPEACQGLADKAVPVMMKYAWGNRIIEFVQSGAGVEEIALAVYAAPMVLATVAAAREDAAERAAKDAPAPEEKEVRPSPVERPVMQEAHGHAGD